jgi:hypothetical protein
MTGRRYQSLGLFLAAIAAFGMGFGAHHVAQAANPTDAEKMIGTDAGRAALQKAGLSAEQFKAMLSKLTPGQRATVEEMARDLTPKARLTARMVGAGYTLEEAKDRIAVLTGDEIAKLADEPNAVSSGAGVGAAIVIITLIFAVVLIMIYYVFVEEPPDEDETSDAPPAK